MAARQLTVRLTVSWWLRWYLRGVALFAVLHGVQPDPNKVCWWIRRAIKVKVL